MKDNILASGLLVKGAKRLNFKSKAKLQKPEDIVFIFLNHQGYPCFHVSPKMGQAYFACPRKLYCCFQVFFPLFFV